MKVFISDLHLGCGDERDDFLYPGKDISEETLQDSSLRNKAFERMHEIFDRFVDHLLQMNEGGEPPELVLLGDIFDLLQVEPVEAQFRKPSRLKRILDAHNPFFDSLNRFSERGGILSYVVGNHDHELVDKKLFKTLRKRVPTLNRTHGGKPLTAYIEPKWGIYGEHGNQFDPTNRFEDFMNPDEIPLGSIVVVKLVNPFEPICPMIDNIQGTYQSLWYGAARLSELFAPELEDEMKHHQQAYGGVTATLINHVIYVLVGKGIISLNPVYLPLIGEAVKAAESIISHFIHKHNKKESLKNKIRILTEAAETSILGEVEKIFASPKRVRLLEPLPEKLNVLLLGHTHKPLTLRTESGIYANCGCWRPRARALYQKVFRLQQTLNYVKVTRTSNGKIRVRLHDFARLLDAKE